MKLLVLVIIALLSCCSVSRHTASTSLTKTDPISVIVRNSRKQNVVITRGNGSLGILFSWLYFLANAINIPGLPAYVNAFVNDGDMKVSPKSMIVYGNILALDSLLTFCSVNLVGVLSDQYGRKPFMILSCIGLATAYGIVSIADRWWMFYIAASIDGCSSSMLSQAQSYIADCARSSDNMEALGPTLGRFQGIAIGLAYFFGVPLGSYLSTHVSLKAPLFLAVGLCTFAALSIALVLPESINLIAEKSKRNIKWSDANPIGAIKMLTTRCNKLALGSAAYLSLCLAHSGAHVMIINDLQHRLGCSQLQSGLAFTTIGLTVTILPKLLTTLLGERTAILTSMLCHGVALALIGASTKATRWLAYSGVILLSIGVSSLPLLLGYLTDLVSNNEIGALQGAEDTLRNIANVVGYRMFSNVAAYFLTGDKKIFAVMMPQGAAFFLASLFSVSASLFFAQATFDLNYIQWTRKVQQDKSVHMEGTF